MRPLVVLVVLVVPLLLSSLGCARRPDVCEEGSRTAPLCHRIDALERELEERSDQAATAHEHEAQQAQVSLLTARLAQLEDALEMAALTGVPACDDYIRRYSRCIDEKMPEPAKEPSRKALWTSIRAWQNAAATHAGRDRLALACRTAADAVKASCGWD